MLKTINNGKMPERATKYSASVDLFSNEDVIIKSRETKVIGLGVCIDLEETKKYPDNFFLSTHYIQLMLRSSLGVKGLVLPNGVGIIDLDYADELKMIIHNTNKEEYIIKVGDKIAQAILLKHLGSYFGIETDVIRNGGLGSTGE